MTPIEFFISYWVYTVGIGFTYLGVQYLRKERPIQWKELLLLLFLPVYGWGRWRYRVDERSGEWMALPKQWYLFKFAVVLHNSYLVALGLYGCFLAQVAKLNRSAWESDIGHPSMIGVEILVDAGVAIGSGIFYLFSFLIAYFCLWFVLVKLPSNKLMQLEKDYGVH
ncbi:MAG: hypothetical protein AAFV80_22475 [Bacteroidota bacterium]